MVGSAVAEAESVPDILPASSSDGPLHQIVGSGAAAEAPSVPDILPASSDGPLLTRSSSNVLTKDQQSSGWSSLFSNSRSSSSLGEGNEGPAKKLSPVSSLSQWARGLRMPSSSSQESSSGTETPTKASSPFSLVASGFGKRIPAKIPLVEAPDESSSSNIMVQEGNALGAFTKGFLDSSRNAVKAVQLKARHLVSQNKRRYQEGGFDLDLAYITENIIAMGFPAGDISSGLFGYVEGFYRNHMEEVIKFLETQHTGKYKVYNLCSERLYDASLLEGKVACFPFDDHNCPPLQLVAAFCQSAYSWLKEDLQNVVVVHCKAGMARTGLMITSLLLYLKFFPTAEESINYYNQKRCVDGKGLVLPSQLRYVKYFECVLREFNGKTPVGRKCILRGIRLHKCPYWIRPAITISDHNGVLFSSKKHHRTKDLLTEDIWFSAPRKGVVVFALPGERCVADLNGDFKVHFNDRHGDFYCWLNTNMMETRQILPIAELDGFEKRRLPSPGFQVEVVILDHDAPIPIKKVAEGAAAQSGTTGSEAPAPSTSHEWTDSEATANLNTEAIRKLGVDNTSTGVEEWAKESEEGEGTTHAEKEESYYGSAEKNTGLQPGSSFHQTNETLSRHDKSPRNNAAVAPSDFKAIAAASAADASVFTFGEDDEDYDSGEELQ
ncbi:unnamed protein product [Sphagnum jensenii]|uniref:Uncharacterized protein n=1 Tax=Sphagnum jensenii TaxID=128206 RepID=A0ABP1AN27_9BRYO